MHKGALKDQRCVLPRWRSLDKTPGLELLSSLQGKDLPALEDSVFSHAIEEWRTKKTLESAAEIASSAAVFGAKTESLPALYAIVGDESDAVGPLRAQAQRILERDTNISQKVPLTTIGPKERLRALKERVRTYPRDGLGHIELAREQVNLGQGKSAKRYVESALKHCPDNRYVVRSAARYFVHQDDNDRALDVVRRSNLLNDDPWIQSAEVAVSAVAEQASKFASKQLRQLSKAKTIRRDYSELAAGLAALELEAGSVKKSKQLFEMSMSVPNENALAQLRWAQTKGIPSFSQIQPSHDIIDYPFEADTYRSLLKTEAEKAAEAAVKWHEDEPYSSRPATIGSSLCLGALNDSDRALEFIERGLIINPNADSLINNKIVALARKGKVKAARELLLSKRSWLNERRYKAFYYAADGLISFREGRFVSGAQGYAKSYEAAKKDDSALALQALMYWLEEEARFWNEIPPHVRNCIKLIDEKIEKMKLSQSHIGMYWSAIRARIELPLVTREILPIVDFSDDAPKFFDVVEN